LQPLLLPLANQHAPGARPEGQPVSGFISQGQPATTAVQIAPGKCYTAIAVASPPIGDLMLELVATPPAPFPPVTLSQAAGGTQVVMAGQPNCFRPMSPVAVNGVLRVTSRQGSGPVLAQLYAKLAAAYRRPFGGSVRRGTRPCHAVPGGPCRPSAAPAARSRVVLGEVALSAMRRPGRAPEGAHRRSLAAHDGRRFRAKKRPFARSTRPARAARGEPPRSVASRPRRNM
jgi:hypothetical protein